MSILSFILLLFLCYCVTYNDANDKKWIQSSEKKLKSISELSLKSKSGVITLDDSSYSYYAATQPRPYNLIVFLTASHPKFKCTQCGPIDTELKIVASSYYSDNTNRTHPKNDQLPIFFLRLDYESSQKIFQQYQVVHVPVMFYVSPYDGETGNAFDINPRYKYQHLNDPDASKFADFIRDVAGTEIHIKRSMFWTYVILLLFFSIIASLVRPVINNLPYVLGLVQFKAIWFVVCMFFYTISISGIVFDVLRTPPMYHTNHQTGETMYFYPQSGSQFVVEGFAIGFLNIACSIGAILLAVYAPKFKKDSSKQAAMYIGIIIAAAAFMQIRSLYVMKNRWYGMAM